MCTGPQYVITVISVVRSYGRKANEEPMSERSRRGEWTRVGREACSGRQEGRPMRWSLSPRDRVCANSSRFTHPDHANSTHLLVFTSQQSTSQPPPTPLSQIHLEDSAISVQFACSQSQMQARFHQNSSAVSDRRLPRNPFIFNKD